MSHHKVNDRNVYPPELRGGLFDPNHEDAAAVFDGSGNIFSWDLEENRLTPRIRKTPAARPDRMVFSPDGRFLAAATDQGVRVWEWSSGLEMLRALDGKGWPPEIAFAPDSRGLALAAPRDGAIRVIDALTGEERLRLPGHAWGLGRALVTALAYSPDGRLLASGGSEGTALLWEIPTPAVRPPAAMDDARLSELWQALAGDARTAFAAAAGLIEAGAPAVEMLRARLRPEEQKAEIGRLLKDLDHDDFDVREKASRTLIAKGLVAREAVTDFLADRELPAEALTRVKTILREQGALITDGAALRVLRAILVLEHIATTDAQTILDHLAHGEAHATFTRDAARALERVRTQGRR